MEKLPAEWIQFLHICDAPENIPEHKDGMVRIARDERLYFGEGCIDFSSILQRLPQVPLSIELPHAARVKEFGYEGHARRCLDTAKQQLDHLETRSVSV